LTAERFLDCLIFDHGKANTNELRSVLHALIGVIMPYKNINLAPIIDSLGTQDFHANIFELFESTTGSTHFNLVKIPLHSLTPQTLITYGEIDHCIATECVSMYDNSFFKLDPAFKALSNQALSSTPLLLHTEFKQTDNSVCREAIWDKCHIIDKLSLVYADEHYQTILNLYKINGQDFSSSSILRVQEIDNIIASFINKHISLVDKETAELTLERAAEKLNNLYGHLLTKREAEVCSYIVLGYSSLAISLNLNISINTVLTHRRKSYEKLGIGTQNQLFQIVTRNQVQ
jgi:DNA-binding CsgD family transcriptional regulator